VVSFTDNLQRLQRRRALSSSLSSGPPFLMGKQKRRKGSLAPDPSPPRSVGSSSLASVSSVALPISQIQPSATLPDAQAAVPQTALAIPSPPVPRSGSDLETLPIIDVTSAVTPVPAGAPSAATSVPAVAPSVPCEVTPSRGPSPSPATAPATPVKVVVADPVNKPESNTAEVDSWCDIFKGTSKRLQKQGTAFHTSFWRGLCQDS